MIDNLSIVCAQNNKTIFPHLILGHNRYKLVQLNIITKSADGFPCGNIKDRSCRAYNQIPCAGIHIGLGENRFFRIFHLIPGPSCYIPAHIRFAVLLITGIGNLYWMMVPAFSFKLSLALSREVMTAVRPLPFSRKSMDADILGSIEANSNCP